MREKVLLEEAQKLLLAQVRPSNEEKVSLINSLGRVLSQDVRAEINLPLFNKSALDGYALRAKDIRNASPTFPVSLRVLEEIRAGEVATQRVSPGTTIKIMTGSPIPEGADLVIKYEDVRRTGNRVEFLQTVKVGSNIVMMGEDVSQGEIIGRRGTIITPALIGLLAGLGIVDLEVFARVKVAIISTGDELLDPSEQLSPGKIYNSSLYSIDAYCRELGTIPLDMGIAADKKEEVAEKISRSLEEADIVITTGGVSVGDYDVVYDALKHIGADILFWKVAMKPGSPVIAAVKDKKVIIGLSGNPAAAMVTFHLIAVPVIKKLRGENRFLPPLIHVVLEDNFAKPSPQRRFLLANSVKAAGADYVKLTGEQGNGFMKSMLGCNILVDVPAGSGPLIAGQKINAFYIGPRMEDRYQDNLEWGISLRKRAVSQ